MGGGGGVERGRYKFNGGRLKKGGGEEHSFSPIHARLVKIDLLFCEKMVKSLNFLLTNDSTNEQMAQRILTEREGSVQLTSLDYFRLALFNTESVIHFFLQNNLS